MVQFNLYESDGITLILTFPVVFDSNYPIKEKKIISHENVRGKGSIIISGGEASSDLFIKGVISGTDYDNLMEKVDELEEDCEINVPYVLKIESNTTTHSYNVKRLEKIEWESNSLRTRFQEYYLIFRTNCW